jgi:hypothetical protein
MTSEQAQKLFEQLQGREVIVVLDQSTPGGTVNAVGRLVRTDIEGLWEVNGIGLDPLQPPQAGVARQLSAKVSTSNVALVIELGEISSVSPAAISRPAPGGGGRIVTPFK